MTRKDYVLLAKALHQARPWNADANPKASGPVAWLAAVTCVSHALGIDNTRFDAVRFLKACGVSQ